MKGRGPREETRCPGPKTHWHRAEGPGAAAGGEGRGPDLWTEEERLSCSCVPWCDRPVLLHPTA